MHTISRRRFLGASALGMAAALHADPLGMPIGCQTWPVRESIGKDLDGALRQLSAAGFRTIELCSPLGYAQMGFGPLAALKPAELRERIHAAGLACESCHFGFTELKDHLDDRLTFARELGLKQMIIATFWLPKEASMADWLAAAADANRFGERTRKAGIQLGFHNHDFEFQKIGGDLIYDRLMGAFDPDLVRMQFQVSVIKLGYHAADFFEKYPGRFQSMHLQDWSPSQKKEVALGQGIVDWKRVFAAAKTGGVKNYFVEMDLDAERASVAFLHGLS